ncbi:bifunctional phosphopantothenoylcysteine decarboxylase/phosphopantothenate--cysteine ligase CoaBC [Dasania sp. GY-MA-18]|uniref:Coenzyme A biosynthesis bifunctional protein CoaBC n=1 Tax=Dasania phycosphaerae TaxID=2950436 RepID=A0A9J6RPC8_9GAMM|nr:MULTISPECIES: bifunctional phosphopantothenoylcysteine decarboxylase/phosphopantothenate--cysteine ligase CoaBC [Dasania]MCR8923760.1 bifunctional phosphopantothenoylcysteine decarboxylase/phosphopantothenate--cysteine ligase CoaBC [Dasania sp. GY-MA-18]MCZ0866194.1 bifunctional phosphopantothenoylcysteine decarboxylase/phosphopantothenate--cysteine ligase CoaBC [Dasania phycosphaerae]MCZ0869918.1 bifunctional phosphopantothenoylcysteine decarboxylase/phosphopantothenate--cysteine ligase CoaB
MQQLNNKHILLGVTGGIAAYKAAELIRRLKEHGAHVQVVMTKAAQEFITPLTLQALSGNPVHTSLLDPEAEAAMGHIELARWADLVLVAPASADFMARLTNGQADDLLTTLCLATDAPIAIAPAMNQAMWRDAATQSNAATLQAQQVTLFGPGEGEQACGDIGPGRMLEPDHIAQLTAQQFASGSLDGVKLVITAGPTIEAIDPVRFISNHSSGKMGFALAQAAIDAGASVTLVAGPVHLATPERCQRINVQSAEQMLQAVNEQLDSCDIFIGCAAVADYRPATVAEQKIKKNDDSMSITLVRNPDIISVVAKHQPRPFCVGFAAETENLIAHAQQKRIRKNLDMIIANDVANSAIGFNSDNNAATLITAQGEHSLALASKTQLARAAIAHIAQQFKAGNKPA